MYKVSVHSTGGDLVISGNANYHIIGISGLSPVNATINSSRISGGDGAMFNSASVGMRNIVITILPNHPVAENRQALYKVFGVKNKITLQYSTETRNVQIDGYVESVQADLFTMRQQIQISILCMQPFFKSAQEIIDELSSVVGMFEFPFALEEEGVVFSENLVIRKAVINNTGDMPCGATFNLLATGRVLNPVIYNADDATGFGINIEMQTGDEIIIDTQRGSKSLFLIRDGVRQNIINKRAGNITWFQLPLGESTFTYNADEGVENLTISIGHYNLFGGV